jgi:hypothetical protein
MAAEAMFDITQFQAAGLSPGPFGTITVTEIAGGKLNISQTLNAGYRIHDGNANHNAFAFKIVGDPAITIENLTAGFEAIALAPVSNVDSPPFGSFFTGIDCTTACGPGWNNGYAGTLSFTVSAASQLNLASLSFNTVEGNDVYFTTDVVNANGDTGNVGALLKSTTPPLPEPATWAMMLIGFGMIGGAMRRGRKQTSRVHFAI